MTSVTIGDQKGKRQPEKRGQRQSHVGIRKADNNQKTEAQGGFSPRDSRASVALPTPWFSTSNLQNCKNKFLLFEATWFVIISCGSIGNWYTGPACFLPGSALSQPALQDPLGRVINVTMGLLSCPFPAYFQCSCLAEKVVPFPVSYLLTHFSKSTPFPTTAPLPTWFQYVEGSDMCTSASSFQSGDTCA